ncbi:MAG: GAF domain-containing protein [Myxococcales bacterium]|jgi:phosphotransferase system enzyme I (PtsP)|nr:GAF domain-containing protein [Myxococcales bacterium]
MATAGRPKVHSRGNARLDALLDFLAFAARPMPLVRLLDEAPHRIASIFDADVCSVYLLEGEGDELVMRANVGLKGRAIGQVRLAVGEGITGEAVEYMRPVSCDSAVTHASYKHFDDVGEEEFPVFLAVPILGKAGALGALVVQRRARPFEVADIELLSTLGAVVGGCVRHAELIDTAREKAPRRRAGGGTRKVTLPGRPVVLGRALGAIAALRRPAARQSERQLAVSSKVDDEVRLLEGAFDVAAKATTGIAARARRMKLGSDAAFLSTYLEILTDGRFRERATELLAEGGGIAQALSRLAREVTRTATSITKDAFLEERARDIEDLCDALTMLAAADKRAELPTKALLVGDALTMFDLLISARAHPVGVALTERASGPRTRVLLQLLEVPAIVGVQGLFRWAGDGDVALLDADHGLLVINPSKSEIMALREYKRQTGASAGDDDD